MRASRKRRTTRGFAFAVLAICAVNVAVFVAECTIPSGLARERFIDGYALIPYDLRHLVRPDGFPVPTVATLVTAQFLHGSVLHLASNMAFFIVFAPRIEAFLGHLRFLAFYLTCGVLGGLAQASTALSSHVPAIGASGAIAGVLGAYLVCNPTQMPALLVIGLWAALQFVHGFAPVSDRVLSEQGGGTAYFAHIGGFLAGIILVGAFAGRGRAVANRRRSSYYSR